LVSIFWQYSIKGAMDVSVLQVGLYKIVLWGVHLFFFISCRIYLTNVYVFPEPLLPIAKIRSDYCCYVLVFYGFYDDCFVTSILERQKKKYSWSSFYDDLVVTICLPIL
jgi:hypothetical protein